MRPPHFVYSRSEHADLLLTLLPAFHANRLVIRIASHNTVDWPSSHSANAMPSPREQHRSHHSLGVKYNCSSSSGWKMGAANRASDTTLLHRAEEPCAFVARFRNRVQVLLHGVSSSALPTTAPTPSAEKICRLLKMSHHHGKRMTGVLQTTLYLSDNSPFAQVHPTWRVALELLCGELRGYLFTPRMLPPFLGSTESLFLVTACTSTP